jgi:hypothetical protein
LLLGVSATWPTCPQRRRRNSLNIVVVQTFESFASMSDSGDDREQEEEQELDLSNVRASRRLPPRSNVMFVLCCFLGRHCQSQREVLADKISLFELRRIPGLESDAYCAYFEGTCLAQKDVLSRDPP